MAEVSAHIDKRQVHQLDNGPTMLANELTPFDNVISTGEHADFFCEWQRYMEGGANSGTRAVQTALAFVA